MKVIDEEGEWRIYFGNGDDPPVVELYNLSSDLAETENLKDTRKDKAEEFQSMWVKWLENYEYENDSSTLTSPQALYEVRLYPNPVESLLQIDIHPNKVFQIHVFDSGGHLVTDRNAFDNTVDFSGFRSGTYLVQVTSEKGIILRQKVIKQ
jgi:hypothetical protein